MEIRERIPQLTRFYFEGLDFEITSDGAQYVAALPDHAYRVDLIDESDGHLRILVNERVLAAFVTSDPQAYWVTLHGRTFRLARSAGPARQAATHHLSADLAAPMPGQVRSLNVTAGDLVSAGQLLATLEAMKMEIRLSAPFDARVVSVEVHLGQSVERGQVIIHLQPS